jgi:hypothetical protein
VSRPTDPVRVVVVQDERWRPVGVVAVVMNQGGNRHRYAAGDYEQREQRERAGAAEEIQHRLYGILPRLPGAPRSRVFDHQTVAVLALPLRVIARAAPAALLGAPVCVSRSPFLDFARQSCTSAFHDSRNIILSHKNASRRAVDSPQRATDELSHGSATIAPLNHNRRLESEFTG